MGNNYVFSLQPTFTQGLILGQLSILLLLGLILKYLFIDSSESSVEAFSYHPRLDNKTPVGPDYYRFSSRDSEEEVDSKGSESADWFNIILQQVAEVYRSKLRNDQSGPEGDEIARQRIEDYVNRMRPPGFLDYIKIYSVNLGASAPRLSNARSNPEEAHLKEPPNTEVDLRYTDTLSVSLSTSYLFNYPMTSFARLPISLTISLSLFQASIILTPPSPTSPVPVLTIAIPPDFTLDLKTTSLMGSRAKLADVPKLHELIQHQVRRMLAARAVWKVVLPGLGSVADAQQEMREQLNQEDAKS
jgi:maintenance of morphology protein 1